MTMRYGMKGMVVIAAVALILLLQGCDDSIQQQLVKDFGIDQMATGTLLHRAALDGQTAQAEQLLNNGADVNEHNSAGYTPLHLAAAKGRLEMAQLLLDHGAEINALEGLGLTPLHLAVQNRQPEMVALLVSRYANTELQGKAFGMTGEAVSPLDLAAVLGETASARILIEQGKADLASRTSMSKHTPLHAAAEADNSEVVALLLESGAQVDARDTYGETPLHYAAREGAVQSARLLIAAGADINAKNENGSTPMTFAVNQHNEGIISLLRGE